MNLTHRSIDDLAVTLWNGRRVSMRGYLAALKKAKRSPDTRYDIGGGESMTGRAFLARHRRCMDQSISERGEGTHYVRIRDAHSTRGIQYSTKLHNRVAASIRRRVTNRIRERLLARAHEFDADYTVWDAIRYACEPYERKLRLAYPL